MVKHKKLIVRRSLPRKVIKSKSYYAQLTDFFANKHGLNPIIFRHQINQESGFNPRMISNVGAIGIAQIMPETARLWGVNPYNPHKALNAAAKNMAYYVKKYRSKGYSITTSYKLAMAAYNAGEPAVDRLGPKIYSGRTGIKDYDTQTKNYVNSIVINSRRF